MPQSTAGKEQKLKFPRFISLPLLSRFSVGSPPYIKAMIIFLTTTALVTASGNETLTKRSASCRREAIFRVVMNTVNPSTRSVPFSHLNPYHADE